MNIFKDVVLGFNGDEFTVKHDEVMKLICELEDIISLNELVSGGTPKLGKLATAYTVALNYAGSTAKVNDVYASLFASEGAKAASQAITGLLVLMLPPETYNNESATGEKKAVKKPRKKVTKKQA